MHMIFGWFIALLVVLQAVQEWTGAGWAVAPVVIVLLPTVVLMALGANLTGRIFLAVAMALTLALVATMPDWRETLWRALFTTSFFIAFFSALTILRNAAQSSPSMIAAGTYLSRQPPGRRYLALTFGTQAFGLVLNYGSIQLLGALAVASAEGEPDRSIREIRIRRMLLAIQRGFASSLPWSPLSFSIVIALSVFPDTSWAALAVPGIVTSVIMSGSGWALDSLFKPRRPPGARAAAPESPGRWTALLPLALLLALLLTLIVIFEESLGLRVVAIVLVVVPAISVVWLRLQTGSAPALGSRLATFIGTEVASYRNEILLIASAGYLGIVGAALLGPAMQALGLDLAVLPGWALLLGLVWIMPILGQLGANPILSMSLVGPLLPAPEAVGLTGTGMAVALICGWVLTGVSSPFTATNLLVGRFAGIRAIEVGWVWNRTYFLVVIVLLCAWALIHGLLIG